MPRQKPSHKKSPKPKFLILCEGKKTEIRYFKYLIIQPEYKLITKHYQVSIYSPSSNDPVNLVNNAITILRSKDRYYSEDIIWVVFDKDNKRDHKTAFQRAKNKINIAFSSISFEIWILLHFTDSVKYYSLSKDVRKEIEKYYPEFNKTKPAFCKNIYPETETAITKAIALNKRMNRDNPGKPIYELNPYTDVYKLLGDIKSRIKS